MADGNITVDVLNMDVAIRMRDALAELVRVHTVLNDEPTRQAAFAAARAALAEQPSVRVRWHNPRADKLRNALIDVADTKNVTATSAQFVRALQRIASDALTADAMDEPAEPPSAREPLTDEQLDELLAHFGWRDIDIGEYTNRKQIAFARRIEAMHGIGVKVET